MLIALRFNSIKSKDDNPNWINNGRLTALSESLR